MPELVLILKSHNLIINSYPQGYFIADLVSIRPKKNPTPDKPSQPVTLSFLNLSVSTCELYHNALISI